MLIEICDKLVQLCNVLYYSWLHQRFNCCNEEVNNGLFSAPHTGSVTTSHGEVSLLIEKQGFQSTDPLIHIIDTNKLFRSRGKV